jgi:PEP-CTERM motif
MKYLSLLAVSLLVNSVTVSAQTTLRMTVAPQTTSVSALAIFIKSSTNPDAYGMVPTSLSVAAGEQLNFSTRYSDLSGVAQYSFLGVYGAGGVVVAVDNSIASALVGRSWESVFTSPAFSENTVYASFASFANVATEDDDYAGVAAFADYLRTLRVTVNGTERELFPMVGSASTLLNFSQAYLNGSASLQAVPEPGTLLYLLPGMSIVALAGRRRRARALSKRSLARRSE